MTEQTSYVGRHRAPESTTDTVLVAMLTDEDCTTAIDGCPVGQAAQCSHGFPSWVIALGL